ncbi:MULTISPECIES: phosphopantetheine-binding protein [unclassified Micromonospora]|uniref:phosphopantetheine-binding protein n=1 Tax=Micromonospora TaxID=1873 RepID=UPI002416EA25|nr:MULTISPECIES: phosphopantetheine-binding protein [unclassified Micromonospora]MDG4820139.1 phosphopantetheine-binding protein [Micromonospora sp. WMMD956]WFE56551.1 phosphopantetheine-binding protein [Micromonospora sp. WMMD712]
MSTLDPRFVAMLEPFLPFAAGEPITEESDLRELGLDSMQAIELMFAVEDTFAVVLPDDALTEHTFATAGSLWQVVSRAMGDSVVTS